MLVHSVGLFLTGLLLGLLVATAGLVATEPFYELPNGWVPAGALLGLSLLGAVLALRWQKVLTVVSTAVFGAAVLTLCLDYAVENLALGHHRLASVLLSFPSLAPSIHPSAFVGSPRLTTTVEPQISVAKRDICEVSFAPFYELPCHSR
uniref:Transmembrane protein 198 n=1 Tax=Naja naja TaxID=35670 RepID=A0A8C6V802_NAJNA